MKTISATTAAALVLAAQIDLTYGHDIIDGDWRIIIKPMTRDHVIDAFYTLAMVTTKTETDIIEQALTNAAQSGDATFAASKQSLLRAFWTLHLATQSTRLLKDAVTALDSNGQAAAA